MKTSVVIPAYNGLDHLKKNLQSVVDLDTDEIIIVDDASQDESADFISTNFPKVKLVKHRQNIGFTRSVNDGFNTASGDIVFLLNQDVVPASDLVKKTLAAFKDPSIFAVSFNENDSEYSYSQVTWVNGFLQFGSGPMSNYPHVSAWASGGSAAFRRVVWNHLGGFDPIFSPGYYEDLDLGLRATAHGYKIIWDPTTKVQHDRETSFKKEYAAKKLQRIKDRNYLLTQWKHLPQGMLRAHVVTLIKKVVNHPGFIFPLFQALVLWQSQKSQ